MKTYCSGLEKEAVNNAFGCALKLYHEIDKVKRFLFLNFILAQYLSRLFHNLDYIVRINLLNQMQVNEHYSHLIFNQSSTNMRPFQIEMLVNLVSEMIATIQWQLQHFFIVPITEHTHTMHHNYIPISNHSKVCIYSINVLPSKCLVFQIFQVTR